MIGRVVSAKTAKTVVVLVERTKTHPLYNKSFVSTKRYLVDDQLGTKEGDVVEILKVKPVSKRKHFRVTRVLGQDIVALGEQAMKETAKQAIEEVLPEEKEEAILAPNTTASEGVENTAEVKSVKKEKASKKEPKEKTAEKSDQKEKK